MRKLYAERREATAAGLEGVLGKHMRIDPQPGGMHLILRLNGPAVGPRGWSRACGKPACTRRP